LEMEYDIAGKWHKTGTCFKANGDEKYLGISTPTGGFSVNPPCVIHDDHSDVFYVYYFDIDDIKLTKLPDKYTARKTICAGRTTKINIADLAGLPIMQKE